MRKRNPFLSGVLSFMCPGMGQLYNGQEKLSLLLLLLSSFLVYSQSIPLLKFEEFLLALFVGIVFMIFNVGQAVYTSYKKRTIELQWFNNIYVYTIFFVVGCSALITTDVLTPKASVAFSSNNQSMAPAIMKGDTYTVQNGSNSIPIRGDIYAYIHPKHEDATYIKRIIGLPGDEIQIKNDILYINRKPIDRTRITSATLDGIPTSAYIEHLPNGVDVIVLNPPHSKAINNTISYTIPEDTYFFLGDNRYESQDSRSLQAHGFVPRGNLIGKALYIYFSSDIKRIGKSVQ